MKKIFIWINFSLFSLLLTGCVTLKPAIPAANQSLSMQQRAMQLRQINAWQIRGSVSIQHDNKTDIATLAWKQQDANYDITLYGPLSLGYVGIAGQPGSVTFTRTNQRAITAASPEQLMQQQLGWQMPVSDLYYWVRGLPGPGAAKTEFDRYNHLTHLVQNGWDIHYLGYMQVDGKDLPHLMQLENTRLKIRLVIKDWGILVPRM